MALTKNITPITFSSASSVACSTNNAYTSDAIAFDPTDIAGAIQVYANNGGTPASGDTLSVYISYCCGDVTGDSSDDYDTTEHAQFLGILNTYPSDTPGENPAIKTFPVSSTVPKAIKLIVQAAQGASRTITVRANLETQRAA